MVTAVSNCFTFVLIHLCNGAFDEYNCLTNSIRLGGYGLLAARFASIFCGIF